MTNLIPRTEQTSPAAVGTARHLVSLREDVVVDRQGADLVLSHRWGSHAVREVSDGVAVAVERLTFGPVLAENVLDLVITAADDPLPEITRMQALVNVLQFLFVHSVELDSVILADVVPTSSGARFNGFGGPQRTSDTERLSLSRFSYLHQVEGVLILENPLSRYRARLYDPLLAALLAAGASPRPVADLVAIMPEDGRIGAHAVLDLLLAAGLLDSVNRPRPPRQQTRLRQWGFHDLLFHSRSRSGRHDEEIGATFRFTGEIDHEAPIRELPAGVVLPLPRPDLTELLAADATLTEVLETRQSIRLPGEAPLRLDQLAELLYRAARIRAVYGPAPHRQMPYEAVDRPYPSGGGAGDLDIWLTANRCADLPRGMYYYDPAGHQLVLVNSGEADIEAMLGVASVSAGNSAAPDVLLTITSRFQRLGWKYSGIPYATTLKHVGVLYQTLYLVSTAMGLAPCGLGVGDIDLSTRCFGLDWERESSVGDFMISSAPADTDRSRHASQNGPGWRAYNSADWRACAPDPISGPDQEREG
ncbi:MAG TPA: SagB family peptide dehydrogenase [Pseudonocardiaceae bacterium]|jgi:SagB-type dehydrogenase family enzyme|nr:SagB family peptide dehydrogenase [Pseudonocardiaceae bacterium]